MSRDGGLPPGVTDRDIAERFGDVRRRGEVKYLRCIGCHCDFPAEEIDEEHLCAVCAKNEDDPRKER